MRVELVSHVRVHVKLALTHQNSVFLVTRQLIGTSSSEISVTWNARSTYLSLTKVSARNAPQTARLVLMTLSNAQAVMMDSILIF